MKGLGDQKLDQPKSLGEAGKSMGKARGQPQHQDLPDASGDQKNALDAMRSAASDLAKKLMESGKQGQEGDTDPLGRTGRTGAARNGK